MVKKRGWGTGGEIALETSQDIIAIVYFRGKCNPEALCYPATPTWIQRGPVNPILLHDGATPFFQLRVRLVQQE